MRYKLVRQVVEAFVFGRNVQHELSNSDYARALPSDWTCPVCGAPKEEFENVKWESMAHLLLAALFTVGLVRKT